jgi:hypothetical protein
VRDLSNATAGDIEERHTFGGGIHVRERGRGAPVLFLHGNPDTCEMWDGVVQRMA